MFPLLLALPSLTQDAPTPEEKFTRRMTPVVEVVESRSPAVVYIQTEAEQARQDIFGRLMSQRFTGAGSGVVILKQGFIITNYHVVKNAERITVSFDKRFDEQEYPANLVSYVPEQDLALLKIQSAHDFPTIPLGTSSDLMPGETVIAIGNPYGQTHTVSVGIISGLHRNIQVPGAGLVFDDLIQTDASINFGNSGGPLLNINGDLIGINSAMNAQAQNIGFAIPVDRVKSVLEDQLLSPDTAPTWLGFEVDPGEHLQIAKVVPGGPADQAGLSPGDCIVAVAGQPVVNHDQYRLARVGLSPQRDVEIQVERQGRTRRVKLAAWDKPDGILFERMGLKGDLTVLGRMPYFRVVEIRPDGPADKLGLESGDLLNSLRPASTAGARPWRIQSREALASLLLTHLASGTAIEIDVLRDENKDGRFQQDEQYRGVMTLD